MKTVAAVLVELGKPLEMAELEVPTLRSGQVLVEIAFSGVCHTQVLECRGDRGDDPYLPHCLGHEGSGIICDVGPQVTKVKVGDRVILSWIKGRGADVPGAVYRWNGRQVNAGGITTFSRHAVISENRVAVITEGISMQDAALLGCAIPTGVGAVLNTAQPKPGSSVAVFGVGGIGLCAVGGAVAAGCTPIIAVDIRQTQLELARQMGATHGVQATEEDPIVGVSRICPGGVDVAIEASGRPAVMVQALQSVRSQGGVAVIIGNARHGERVVLDPWQLNLGKRLLGTWGGDNMPDRDYPRYGQLLSSGKLNVKPLQSRSYRLEDINQAIDDLDSGRVTRPFIHMAGEVV